MKSANCEAALPHFVTSILEHTVKAKIRQYGERVAAEVAMEGGTQRGRSDKAFSLLSLRDGVWKPAAQPLVMFYDAPFTLPFVRRNEVAVRVQRRAG